MGDMHDAWFFIGIFVFIFLIWIATGGPLHPLAFTGPRLAAPGPLGGGTYLSLPQAPFSIGDSGAPNSFFPSFGGGSTFDSSSSLYRSILSIGHYVSSPGSEKPENEYVEVSVNQNAEVPVKLTGWTLTSGATGNSTIIPKGTELPTSGVINEAQDIILTPGQRAVILSGRSPIGASFRENKCIGYFSSFQDFYPSLPQNCPTPSEELAMFYGGGYIRDAACIDYVDTLGRCQAALTPPVTASGACQSFIVKYLNYNGCVEAHRDDPDFAGDTWRVYLGRTSSMWRTRHEIVKLIDAQGKTVDTFSY
ncbi:MAG: hypothetical protein Q7T37_01435 [bacterium]|nr:hypothetical protein [bacterium]MDO8742295.1 hypothetical protein [bacterium]